MLTSLSIGLDLWGLNSKPFSTIICNYLTVNIQITLVLYFNSIILFLSKLFLHYLSFCTRLSCFSLFHSSKIYFSGVKLLRQKINYVFQK